MIRVIATWVLGIGSVVALNAPYAIAQRPIRRLNQTHQGTRGRQF